MVISILIGFFFSVNDSMVTFKKPYIKVIAYTDTSATVLYKGKVEEYETGTYYYPKFMIKEINVKKRKNRAVIKIRLRKKRLPIIKGKSIIFLRPAEKFFIKVSRAKPSEIKTLLKAANLKCTWLDSLRGRYYTIYGVYTENTLKKELLKYERGKKTRKVKKR